MPNGVDGLFEMIFGAWGGLGMRAERQLVIEGIHGMVIGAERRLAIEGVREKVMGGEK